MNSIVLDHISQIKNFTDINITLAKKADIIFRSIRRTNNRKNKIKSIFNETN